MTMLTDARIQCAFMLRHARVRARVHSHADADAMFTSDPELFDCLSIIFRQLMRGDFIQ